MKILVVGGGGREHAIVWKLSQSKYKPELFCAPGNGGIANIAKCVPIAATDIAGITDFVCQNGIDLTVVAPDDPLAMGMVNALNAKGKRAFGPTAEAALIESSKIFSKNLMRKYNIPTADYQAFDNADDALAYVSTCALPTVVKADGLALGKGVIICNTRKEAEDAVNDMLNGGAFGKAGSRIVVEQFIKGPEVSVLCFTDGNTIVPMVTSQDHKRALDNDQGLNTGGMGTFSPSVHYKSDNDEWLRNNVLLPTINAMKAEGREFSGVLYFGLMLTDDGIKVLEYNARFGDPETQVILPRLKTDLVDIFNAVIDKKLAELHIEWDNEPCVCVVLASGGYPKEYKKGLPITGVKAAEDSGAIVFHAGTALKDGKLVTNGGRVMGVTACGATIAAAREKAYAAVSKISFVGMHYRTDIGIK